ncbi:heparan-alpha-glucosaminide N-acetyltransferase domain-containing protein [Kineothrix sp. MB12-C1]|uniref:heparan-alpha-glucosaminide N-acetyltransferase domain-containing protein n=1 Tax=Kineothrix sp. MB12-C1 TaxID=3070215 RepID=UPI0027D27BC7|nr:heparan-alpha-glucosaminide N-acetyltransferase domain-containing protein [Kineothrix sp. MB12-C1]WMC93046.1 heparan-alpha-glucosaminide N-acetyltransferase domain-containing protein [Kineothrix sp. MB12-C1]
MGKKQQSGTRYGYLDYLRGMTLISMILYHTAWDLVYIAGWDWAWFRSEAAYIWQQSICWTFIALSGFCWPMGRHRLRRGVIVFGAGLLVTAITLIATPQQRVVFGVLTLLGSCMLVMIPLYPVLRRIPSKVGVILSFLLFVVMKRINSGYLGIGNWVLAELPKEWYEKGNGMTFLGFTDRQFFSIDYFSFFPWFFLFVTGYFIYRYAKQREFLRQPFLQRSRGKMFSFMGRHSLIIYLLHQPVIYLILQLFY